MSIWVLTGSLTALAIGLVAFRFGRGFSIVVARVLVLVGLVGMGMFAWMWAHEGQAPRPAAVYVPMSVSWLMGNASSGDESRAAAAFDELYERLARKKLKENEINEVIATALRKQVDRSASWDQRWGRLVEKAHAMRILAADKWTEYLSNIAEIKIEVQSPVRQGDELLISDKRVVDRTYETKLRMDLKIEIKVGELSPRELPGVSFVSKEPGESSTTYALTEAEWKSLGVGKTLLRTIVSGKVWAECEERKFEYRREREIALEVVGTGK